MRLAIKLLYFASAFRGRHFDVVHCHFGMNGLIGCYLKSCGFADQVVRTFHGADINLYFKMPVIAGEFNTLYNMLLEKNEEKREKS